MHGLERTFRHTLTQLIFKLGDTFNIHRMYNVLVKRQLRSSCPVSKANALERPVMCFYDAHFISNFFSEIAQSLK